MRPRGLTESEINKISILTGIILKMRMKKKKRKRIWRESYMYMRIVYWCISTVVVNSWLLYRRHLKNQVTRTKYMTLLDFQLSIANELLHASNITSINPRKRSRPSAIPESMEPGSSSPASPVPSNVTEISSERSYISEPPKSMRLDQTGHWVEWGGKGKYRLCQTGIPKSKCSKCKVHLCCNPQKNCFVSYHT